MCVMAAVAAAAAAASVASAMELSFSDRDSSEKHQGDHFMGGLRSSTQAEVCAQNGMSGPLRRTVLLARAIPADPMAEINVECELISADEIAAEMGGFGGEGRETANAVTFGSSFKEKSDLALKRQQKAEDKFKALAHGTPANLSGKEQIFELLSPDKKLHMTPACWRDFQTYVEGWKGWRAVRRLPTPLQDSNGKLKRLYLVEVCLVSSAPAAKPFAGAANNAKMSKAVDACLAENSLSVLVDLATSASAPKPFARAASNSHNPKAATEEDEEEGEAEEALRRESLAETPQKGRGGARGKRKTEGFATSPWV
ncbi:hypothetical protein T484DRAFT_1763698 [Baffinella frigidus]|nr:hypothetical protein T484DRAFT_1763698 [Cryptophyta sp. CCMP2293]